MTLIDGPDPEELLRRLRQRFPHYFAGSAQSWADHKQQMGRPYRWLWPRWAAYRLERWLWKRWRSGHLRKFGEF